MASDPLEDPEGWLFETLCYAAVFIFWALFILIAT